MSWLTSRDAQNALGYRYIRFVGGRILQDKELNALQDSDALREKYGLGSIFRDGATANVKVTLGGGNVTLEREDVTLPVMLVFFNGAFEPLADQVIPLPAPKVNGTDMLYLHWVLWRVTSDGTYQSREGCLADPTLVDLETNEPVGERGQLQFILSFDQTLSAEPADTDRMIAKSNGAVPVFQFQWTASVASYVPQPMVNSYLLATNERSGMVKINSADSNGTAVGIADPRLTDMRDPKDASVYTAKVKPAETTGAVTAIASQEVRTGAANGGIDADRVFWTGIRARLSDTLNYLYAKIAELMASKTAFNSRITALENEPDQVIDLSFHVGKKLGRFSDGGFSHQPVVDDDEDGYRHYSGYPTLPPGAINYSSKWAFGTHRRADGQRMGGIRHDGDYELSNPNMASALAAAFGGTPVNSFYKLALLVATRAMQANGGVETQHLQMMGDVQGDSTGTTVIALQNTPVDKYRADTSAAQNGDVLTYQNGVIRPASPPGGGGGGGALAGDVNGATNATQVTKIGGKVVDVSALAGGQFLGYDGAKIKGMTAPGAPSLDTPAGSLPIASPNQPAYSIAYTIVNFGTYKLAFGSGVLPSGAVVPFPAGWNKSWTSISATLAKSPGGAFEVVQPAQANGWTVSVKDAGVPTAWLFNVSVMTITPVV